MLICGKCLGTGKYSEGSFSFPCTGCWGTGLKVIGQDLELEKKESEDE